MGTHTTLSSHATHSFVPLHNKSWVAYYAKQARPAIRSVLWNHRSMRANTVKPKYRARLARVLRALRKGPASDLYVTFCRDMKVRRTKVQMHRCLNSVISASSTPTHCQARRFTWNRLHTMILAHEATAVLWLWVSRDTGKSWIDWWTAKNCLTSIDS